jgi:hypothetical protein
MTQQPGGPYPRDPRGPGGPPPSGPPGPQYGPPGPRYGGQYGQPQYGPPQYGQPQYGPPSGYGQPQPGYGPPPGPPRKGRGGRIALVVVGVLVLLLGVGGFLAYRAYRAVDDALGGVPGGVLSGGTPGAGCSFVSADDVDAVLGGGYQLVELGGLGGLAGPALDSRVLAQAPTCWGVDEAAGKLVRIARYEGGDAAAVFDAEKATARGSSEDRGGGVTVETDGYLGDDVTAGDAAFCTTGDFSASAGALVRTGDRLVYVSTTAAGEGATSAPQIDLGDGADDGIHFATDDANCRLAVALAAKVT